MTAYLIGRGSKPNHADRAVSIGRCFPPIGAASGNRPGHAGSEAKTAPMTLVRRVAAYRQQNGNRPVLTARQQRRLAKKDRRSLS